MNTDTQRKILSVRQRQKLQADRKVCERELNGGVVIPTERGGIQAIPERLKLRIEGGMETLGHDPASAQRLRNIDRALADGSPGSLSDSERSALEKERKEFEEWAPKNMAPKKMNSLKAKDDGFSKAVDAAMREHSPEFTSRADKYQNAMRQLDPDNPDAGNIEGLRPN